MNVLEAIHARTSVRKFQDREVPEDAVVRLFRAAMAAPSAKNCQPWHFMAIADKEKLQAISEVLPFGKMLPHAPLGVLILGDVDVAERATPGYGLGYLAQDCSAACENLLLAAVGLGLGAVWLGVHPIPERVDGIKTILTLPDNIRPMCMLAVGYPEGETAPKDKFKEERIHWNRW